MWGTVSFLPLKPAYLLGLASTPGPQQFSGWEGAWTLGSASAGLESLCCL